MSNQVSTGQPSPAANAIAPTRMHPIYWPVGNYEDSGMQFSWENNATKFSAPNFRGALPGGRLTRRPIPLHQPFKRLFRRMVAQELEALDSAHGLVIAGFNGANGANVSAPPPSVLLHCLANGNLEPFSRVAGIHGIHESPTFIQCPLGLGTSFFLENTTTRNVMECQATRELEPDLFGWQCPINLVVIYQSGNFFGELLDHRRIEVALQRQLAQVDGRCQRAFILRRLAHPDGSPSITEGHNSFGPLVNRDFGRPQAHNCGG